MPSLPRNVAFLVVTPDAMAQDLLGALAERLAPLRLGVLAAASMVLRPPLLSALYAHGTFKQPRPGNASSSWLSYAAAELDSSVAAVVRTPFDVDLAGLLDAWKGPSRFGQRHPGDLRSVAPAAHRCHSVLHTADDAAQAALDVAALLGEDTLERVTRSDAPERCGFGELRRLRMPLPLSAAAHPYDVVTRCVVRAAAVLAYDCAATPTASWLELVDLAERTRHQVVGTTAAVAATWRVAAAALAAQLPPPPRPVPGVTPERAAMLPELHAVLGRLLKPDDYDARASLAVESAFDAHGLFLDAWERHTLRIALAFPLN